MISCFLAVCNSRAVLGFASASVNGCALDFVAATNPTHHATALSTTNVLETLTQTLAHQRLLRKDTHTFTTPT